MKVACLCEQAKKMAMNIRITNSFISGCMWGIFKIFVTESFKYHRWCGDQLRNVNNFNSRVCSRSRDQNERNARKVNRTTRRMYTNITGLCSSLSLNADAMVFAFS
jgi:hypothetical protein